MRTIQLVLCTQSPLVLAVRHSAIGGSTPTMDYISGKVIRGALAAALLQQGEAASGTQFQTLFTSQPSALWEMPSTAFAEWYEKWKSKVEKYGGQASAPTGSISLDKQRKQQQKRGKGKTEDNTMDTKSTT